MNSIYTLLSASRGQQRRMDTVSNNLANVNTAGYKKDTAVFGEYLKKAAGQDLESEEEKFVNHEYLSPFSRGGNSYVKTEDVVPNMANGRFKNTGGKLDFALGGKGFFSIETPQGVRYTRNGKFQRNLEGYLVDSSGNKVLGEKGAIKLAGNNISVGVDGAINLDGQEIDTLQIVDFPKSSEMHKMGNSYWAPSSKSQKPFKMENASVHQFMTEGANVNTVEEMANMITINRAYEAVQKAIRVSDGLDEKAISLAQR